ncbi:MAG TPA: LysR family transcriptional regulator [Xanthobacteraceae bacterium]|nr:LysR family transcriptional regulator [Xanthobacteraceae bacterium]
MSDRLGELTAFVRAGETGSFSRVARELGVSQPSISRMVASLEARLGVKLLLRTTRRVAPTDAGGAFLKRARQILGDLDDAENAARGADTCAACCGWPCRVHSESVKLFRVCLASRGSIRN